MAAHSCLYTETYLSQLGPVELRVCTSNEVFSSTQDKDGLHTVGHNILIKHVDLPLERLAGLYRVETATAWMFYIKKRNSSQEQLAVSIELQPGMPAVQSGAETGQNLVAVGFEDGIRQMHIGTEDEEVMAYRAGRNDWMPSRLAKSLVRYDVLISTVLANGLQTNIPVLEPGEQFYFHYILAENPCRPALDYPGEMDISTWVAVNQSKQQVEST